MTKVVVYPFQQYDVNADQNIRSRHYATEKAIAETKGWVRIPNEPGIEVHASDVDGDGRVDPLKAGAQPQGK